MDWFLWCDGALLYLTASNGMDGWTAFWWCFGLVLDRAFLKLIPLIQESPHPTYIKLPRYPLWDDSKDAIGKVKRRILISEGNDK